MIGVIIVAVVIIGALSGYCAYLWRELRRWGRIADNARIVIGYKNKAVGNWPLRDWMRWAQMLPKDQAGPGRIVFRQQNMAVRLAWRPLKLTETEKIQAVPQRQFPKLSPKVRVK